ncbi:MAG: PQQ-binding-like beta-propeller repeat protein [Gammaproteobacteria bacterium]
MRLVLLTAIALSLPAATAGEMPPGEAVYNAHCAACHAPPLGRAPSIMTLQMMPRESVQKALDEGVMKPMAEGLTPVQKTQVVDFLTGAAPANPDRPLAMCAPGASPFAADRPPSTQAWGMDYGATRYVPPAVAGLSAADVPHLALKWAFAYPRSVRVRSQPVLAAGALYVAGQDGTVYALDAETGCVRWTYQARAEVRGGISLSSWRARDGTALPPRAYFSDSAMHVYALDLQTGREIWTARIEDHRTATLTAQPVWYDGVLYQGVSSGEEGAALDPAYPCCTFRGSIVALDAATGAQKWRAWTVDEPARVAGRTSAGTTTMAPSGAPVWNTPTIDAGRGRLLFGTGDNYSRPTTLTSDAIMALDLRTGTRAWVSQTFPEDAWTLACYPFVPHRDNCPEAGPDFDYGAPPVHVRDGGREILVAGQKSGFAFGLSPEDGRVLWQRRLGEGGTKGGVNIGMAAIGATVFVPIADTGVANGRPGLYALDAFTGDLRWSVPADEICTGRAGCSKGLHAAPTAIDGVVFAAHLDGRLRAHDAATGKVLWEFSTAQGFDTASGDVAWGGSIGGPGPMIAGGHLYVNSGYGFAGHMAGNVLLAFEVRRPR